MANKTKHIPMRMCVTCRKSMPKHELVRLALNEEGNVVPIAGNLAGRGTYICKDKACFKEAIKKRSLNRAFKRNVSDANHKQIEESLFGKC